MSHHPGRSHITTDVIKMKAASLDTSSSGVCTVLHMSPSVMAAVIVSLKSAA
jgi:hypothetical protein